jgi:hypothetical protein
MKGMRFVRGLEQLTPEERAKFRAAMEHRCGHGGPEPERM